MTILKLSALLALLIGTSACATSPNLSTMLGRRPALEPSPVNVPPAECQGDAPAREAFAAPVLPPRPVPENDPLAAVADPNLLQNATREQLLASREHWRMRAQRAEPLASAALSYIEIDRVNDAQLDDLFDRCAAEDRRDAAAIAAWAERRRQAEAE